MRKILILITTTAFALGVFAAPAGAGAGTRTVKADNFDFTPKNLTIQKGTKVTWKNISGRHTVTIRSLDYDKTISPDHKTVSKTFRQKGTFNYICRFHKSLGMTGKIIVQ